MCRFRAYLRGSQYFVVCCRIEIEEDSDLDDSVEIVKVIPAKKRMRIPAKQNEQEIIVIVVIIKIVVYLICLLFSAGFGYKYWK